MSFKNYLSLLGAAIFCLVLVSNCRSDGPKKSDGQPSGNQRMSELLESIRKKNLNPANIFCAEAKIEKFRADLARTTDPAARAEINIKLAQALLEQGDEQGSVAIYEDLMKAAGDDKKKRDGLLPFVGVAYLRLAERNNCIMGHNAEACVMPLQGGGIHKNKDAARKAAQTFEELLSVEPDNLDARWLLNIAHMALGEYPGGVPKKWLIPGLDAPDAHPVKPFAEMSMDVGVSEDDRAGGSITEDFDNDGDIDIVTSAWGLDDPMHFFRNNGDGTFSDISKQTGLDKVMGGLNIQQTDYNNDGRMDIWVLRGAWQGQEGYGEQPNSLLRQNPDGTFTDVTMDAGLLSLRPTQAATWNDFNNDGWLDVFIGNETSSARGIYPCELYINNQNGTFTNIASPQTLEITVFAKGVASGDVDNDGWPDIFISALSGQKILLRNRAIPGPKPQFEYVSQLAGLDREKGHAFPCWFFDYDNDGFLDIFSCNYDFNRPLSFYEAREALHPSNDWAGKPYIFHNNHNGTFSNVSLRLGLNKPTFAMGANFGDIDNDGWLDFYLATGNPSYMSLVPNRLFHNMGGQKFEEVTNSSRTGNLQKGHGVSFADLDNDGDQDIHNDLGGAFLGDHYPNSLFVNPGQADGNHFIYMKLEGATSNRAAIGANITVKFTENGKQRMVYREVNSGGSFGSSPLRREIGIGKAAVIDEITVKWPASRTVQILKNVAADQLIKITEGKDGFEKLPLQKMVFKKGGVPMCPAPPAQ